MPPTPATRSPRGVGCSPATFGIDVSLVMAVRGHAEMSVRVPRLRQDAGVVSAVREQERHIGIGQEMDLEDRAPGRDVVPFGAHGEDRHANVVDADRPAADLEAAFRQIVVEEQPSAGTPSACDTASGLRRRSRP